MSSGGSPYPVSKRGPTSMRGFVGVAFLALSLLSIGCASNPGLQASGLAPRGFSLTATSAPTTYKSTVLADGPQLYYRLDEASGTAISDSSGHSHTGALSGTATYRVAGAISGDADGAMGFNGTNTWITATLSGLSSHYSLEAWVNTGWLPEGHIVDVSPQQLMIVGGQFVFGEGALFAQPAVDVRRQP